MLWDTWFIIRGPIGPDLSVIENTTKNALSVHFVATCSNENSWKITKNYFYRDCATIHYMMFEHNPFGLAILWTCLRAHKASESILDDFCSFWSIYRPNKQKMAQNSTFWSTKTLFCVIYKTCSLWYVKITFWAQNLSKLSQKPL